MKLAETREFPPAKSLSLSERKRAAVKKAIAELGIDARAKMSQEKREAAIKQKASIAVGSTLVRELFVESRAAQRQPTRATKTK